MDDPVNKRPRLTRTARYLCATHQGSGLDGLLPLSPLVATRHATDPARLCSFVSPKYEYDPSELAVRIAEWPEGLFFLDTSLFDQHTDDRIWDALLARQNALVLVPEVRQELEPWLATNRDHVATKAVQQGHQAFRDDGLGKLDDIAWRALVYYVRLLAVRSRAFDAADAVFRANVGRAPRDAEELEAFKHRWLGERGYLLARKEVETGTPRRRTDEVVVCAAVSTAIRTAQPTFILTKDEDLAEHFYKLVWLLDTQYRGMLFADAYLDDLSRFARREWPEGAVLEEAFARPGILLERTDEDLEDILPDRYAPVPVACIVGGHFLSEHHFTFETPMRRLLDVKGRTGGLNTERLIPRNCHIWLAPLPLPEQLRGCAAIVEDRRTSPDQDGLRIPMLDGNHAMFTGERYKHFAESAVTLL